MAIAFETSDFDSAVSASTPTTNLTINVGSPSGSNTVLIAFIPWENNTGPANVTAVTYNGASMTQIKEERGNTGSFVESCSMWYLVSPATGSNTLAISCSQSGRDIGACCAVYSDVDQTTPTANAVSNFDTTGTADGNMEITVTSSDTDSMLVWGVVMNRSNVTFTASANNTDRVNEVTASGNSGFLFVIGDRGPESTASSFTCGGTGTIIENSVIGFELREDTGGAPTGRIMGSLAGLGGLAGMGGIAGHGGGLAG